jgi:hypothetical protein
VYVLFGDMTDAEMNQLYNHDKIKAMVSFTRGEGFGRPLLEFTTTGKPVIATNWSGHVDFLNSEYCTLLPGKLTEVHPGAVNKWIIPQSKWFQINYSRSKIALMECFTGYAKQLESSEKQLKHTLENFTFTHMRNSLSGYIENSDIYKVKIHIPIMKPLNIPSTINLPKIKKV